MDIEYFGGTCVSVATKATKVVINPGDTGNKPVVLKGAVEIATDESRLNETSKAVHIFEGPGEYEISDIAITGVAAGNIASGFGSTHYRIEIAEMRVAVVGDTSRKLTETQLEALGVIDIALIPCVDGDAGTLAAIAKQLEPRLIVPLGDAASIVRELGVTVEEAEKLKIKNATNLPAALSVVKLTPRQ